MRRLLNYIITERYSNRKVDHYLKEVGYSRHILIHLKKTDNGILVNGKWAYVRTVLKTGDILTVTLIDDVSSQNIVPMPMKLDIVYEDDDILVINKEADTPIHPSQNNYDNTLANGVVHYYRQMGESFVFRCINRLDRDTTGLLIVAKHMLSAAILSNRMVNRTIYRTYQAIVAGIPPHSGTVDAPIGRVQGSAIERMVDPVNGEQAITHYRVLSSSDGFSLLELNLETGRTHQIRVHMKHLGFPVIGDYIYNPDTSRIHRQALHSYMLRFCHPLTGKEILFTSPLPLDMVNVL